LATEDGHEAIAELLVKNGKVDMNSKGQNGWKLLLEQHVKYMKQYSNFDLY
jgi:hypothetical protein